MKYLTALAIAAVSISSATLAEDSRKSETGFLAPFEHLHFSPSGTPIIHSFGVEPAFTGRDLFLDYTWREGNGVTEHEAEIELEWAFTKRLGIIVEVPYIYEDEENAGSAKGFGDLAIVPRALLIDSDCFLLTAQVETILPTGSSSFGGETAIAPGIAMWNDLGNWFTLNSNVAIEHGFDTDETEFIFGLGLVKSFGEKAHTGHDHDHHHTAAGLASSISTSNSPAPLLLTARTKVTSKPKVSSASATASLRRWTSAQVTSSQSARRKISIMASPLA